MPKKILKIIGSIFFITIFCVGASSLSIPFATGIAGIVPAFTMTLLVWLTTYAISLLYAEALQTLPVGGNFFSLIENHYGKSLKWILGLPYLFFISYLILYYLVILWPPLEQFFCTLTGVSIPYHFLILVIVLATAIPFYFGFTCTLLFASFFAIGHFLYLFLLAKESLPLLHPLSFSNADWLSALYSIPLLYGGFFFPVFVPTLFTYLERDKKSLHVALFFGLALSAAIFLMLEWLVKASFSSNDFWLSARLIASSPFDISLIAKTEPFTRWFPHFYYLAIFDSLLAYGYLLLDILFDVFKIEKREKGKNRFYLLLLVLLPPALLALFSPNFFSPLIDNLVGLYQMLISFLPILIVLSIRYQRKLSLYRFLPDGKPLLYLLFFASLLLLWFQGIVLIQQVI